MVILSWARLLLVLISLSWLQSAQAFPLFKDLPEAHRPAVGKLLVAMPGMADPRFRGTVILLIRYSVRQGAIGLIINRPTRVTLEHEFNDRVAEAASQQWLFWGGPVAMERRVMLVRDTTVEPMAEALEPVFGQLYLANQPQRFWHLLKRDDLLPFRVYAGYSGWRALQLEHEIVRGDWLVIPATEEIVLDEESDSLWPQLINYRHRRVVQLDAVYSAGG